ncbi:hypothetical protein SRS16CHR_03568 [Variovorax sp. SRS16]|uniref:DUF4391 domain-containing protein n=1 Tax=Variovorax sp. SRS16 TaxID=282217 RepID=UPI00131791E4|nr:DUF4391 domain-containing protein [Variovorax sp. SRS16]VTU24984.1 hypothetical protein SRS16CHR_03568 [Variovorax sp. SRS16]
MTVGKLIRALGLPESTRVDQRVPKKLLAEHGAATALDNRQIQDGVEEIRWLAALKPHLIGVPAFEDAQRQYVELAVLSLALKTGAKLGRLVELLHRAVPYPTLLLTASDSGVSLSLAHLRASQNEADEMILDGDLMAVVVPADGGGEAFLSALALARQPQSNLYALYQGWLDTVDALDIARETGRFQPSLTREHALARHAALQQCRQLQSKVEQLRTQAAKERQLARQVTLNQEIRAGQTELQDLQRVLAGEAT